MLKRNLIFLNVGQSMSLTGLMICAFRLSVWKLFVLILREYCKFFLFENSLQKMLNILFSFPSNLSLLILPCLLVLACSFGRSRCFRCCVNFFIIWWLLSSKERVQWALHWFLFQHTLAHVSIHQRKIDNDLREEITKAAILYPTMHFVSSRTQTFNQQENFLPVQFLRPLP